MNTLWIDDVAVADDDEKANDIGRLPDDTAVGDDGFEDNDDGRDDGCDRGKHP